MIDKPASCDITHADTRDSSGGGVISYFTLIKCLLDVAETFAVKNYLYITRSAHDIKLHLKPL